MFIRNIQNQDIWRCIVVVAEEVYEHCCLKLVTEAVKCSGMKSAAFTSVAVTIVDIYMI